MAINDAKPGRPPAAAACAWLALLALAASSAQLAGGGWRGCLRLDAGDRAQIVIDLPPAADTGLEQDDDGAWRAVLETGGVRLRLTIMPDCD